jgi:S-adenosyl-L-methionine hydrolase (adenosine-forming)
MGSSDRPPIIGFLTDFGLDGAAATCRGVMLSICPDARIVDISHTVRKYAVRDGAFVLRATLPYLPVGVHLGVVDPGVGTARRPIATRVDRGDVLVGPDNGLLPPAADALGGALEARELLNGDLWLPVVSSTFHGRDVFSPVTARLAAGSASFADVGPEIPVASLVRIPAARARATEGVLETEVIYVDSFGNLRLAGGPDDLAAAFGPLEAARRLRVRVGAGDPEAVSFEPSFGHVSEGATVLYVDSTGDLALAVNRGDLASRVGAAAGDVVRLERAD